MWQVRHFLRIPQHSAKSYFQQKQKILFIFLWNCKKNRLQIFYDPLINKKLSESIILFGYNLLQCIMKFAIHRTDRKYFILWIARSYKINNLKRNEHLPIIKIAIVLFVCFFLQICLFMLEFCRQISIRRNFFSHKIDFDIYAIHLFAVFGALSALLMYGAHAYLFDTVVV